MNLKSHSHIFRVVATLLLAISVAPGQTVPPPTTSPKPQEVESGGYVIHQSIEVGYRASDKTGSGAMYDTLVDLHGGPRLFEQTLSMQSITHEDVVFDNAFVSSFGWGGDPDNALRARASTRKTGTTSAQIPVATRTTSTITCWQTP